jgi:hypothetical protein
LAGVIKKIRVSRENLPPTLIVDNNTRKSFAITNVISTTNTGVPVYEYTTSTEHNLEAGDFVTITDIVDSVSGDTFNFENMRILTKPTSTTFQIQVAATTTTVYVSGGKVAKNTGVYVVRYRIVSEDRNRASHWSPQYVLSPSGIVENPGTKMLLNQVSGDTISLVWELPKDYKNRDKTELGEFDVYVAWGVSTAGVGSFEYYSTVSGNSANVLIPINPNTGARIYQAYQVAIQNRTSPTKRRVVELTVAETALSFL